MPGEKANDPGMSGLVMGAGSTNAMESWGKILDAFSKALGFSSSQASTERSQVQAESTNWISELAQRYGSVFAPLADVLAPVLRRLSQGSTEAVGNSLLIVTQATKKAARSLDALQERSLLATTEGTLGRLKAAAGKAGIADGDLPGLLDNLHVVLDDGRIRELPGLLDRLKHDFRERGKTGLGHVRDNLKFLQHPDVGRLYDTAKALPAALGQTVSRKALRTHWLKQYAAALRSGADNRIEADLHNWLTKRFLATGIELSESLSILANANDVLVMDHACDRCYEFRRPTEKAPGRAKGEKAPRKGDPDALIRIYGPERGFRYEVGGRKILLPARVLDARQGLAVWSVDRLGVQEALDVKQGPGTLRAWNIGGGRTFLVMFVVQYREGDLDSYLEVGLGCLAAPRGDPLAVGMFALGDILVSTGFSRVAGRQIWGYEKEEAGILVEEEDDLVVWTVEGALRAAFPRGGKGISPPMPLFSYTVKPDDSAPDKGEHAVETLHRTVITRTGEQEHVQLGGERFKLGTIFENLDASTLRPPVKKLYDNLRWFGILNQQGQCTQSPAYTLWTDRMKAELSIPAVVVDGESDRP